jgi:hypothetical protein
MTVMILLDLREISWKRVCEASGSLYAMTDTVSEFDQARVFRPRLLIRGLQGMGQQYISEAILHKLEGLFVQSFDLGTLMEEPGRVSHCNVQMLLNAY